jgi:hypothetical protein
VTEKPKTGIGDITHTAIKAGLGSIPVVGAAAAELFNLIIAPPITQRRDEWVESLVRKLRRLEKKVQGFKIENLAKNDAFITAAMHATQSAIRNHQKEKLDALRNAVLNVALPGAPEDNLALLFISLVDALTPWHLQFLDVFDSGYLSDGKGLWRGGDSPECIGDTVPELKGRTELRDTIIRDLVARGLAYGGSAGGQIVTDTHLPFRAGVTDLGKQFLKFITSPITEDEK